jgi:hypothetical protein
MMGPIACATPKEAVHALVLAGIVDQAAVPDSAGFGSGLSS